MSQVRVVPRMDGLPPSKWDSLRAELNEWALCNGASVIPGSFYYLVRGPQKKLNELERLLAHNWYWRVKPVPKVL